MYHVPVHSLARHLLDHIRQRQLLKAGDRVGVAVSGGIDSVALLRLLLELRDELGIVLSVVHFNHKLRATASDEDEKFVADLTRECGLDFVCDGDDVAGHAREEGVSLETAARELRYGFFRYLIRGNEVLGVKLDVASGASSGSQGPLFHKLDKIVTGHTLDDQAETVLMRMIRGAGMRGLGGIHPRIAVQDDDEEFCGEIVRPLLSLRHRELEGHLQDMGQGWREDATNNDEKFTRNRIRKLVVPLLERDFNPSIARNLAELAEIARGEEDYWENEVTGWMGTAVHWTEPDWVRRASSQASLVQIGTGLGAQVSPVDGDPSADLLQSKIANASWLVMNASVDPMWFLGEPLAVQRRAIMAIGEQAGIPLEFKHVEEILLFAAGERGSGRELSLPRGWKMVRQPDQILFVTPDLREPVAVVDYEYQLPVPGRVDVGEAGTIVEVRIIPADRVAGYNPDQLLDAGSLPGPFRVRNWRAGDRFWPGHTKSPKKIKELLQERHVPQPERRMWPVVTSADEIVWVRGFPSPARFRAKPGCEAVIIAEMPLRNEAERAVD